MYTIDLDTFSEDRLIKSVNEETYLQGKAMFERGLARVVEISDKSAHCIVQDKRSYHVYFKIDKQQLYLQCSCFHAARGLICEHDVAAWLSVSEKLTVQIPPEWRHQLDKMINIGLPQTRNHRSPYYLFFSLQKDPENSSLTWRITAHVLPANALPSGCNPLQLGEKAWIEYIEQDPQLTLRLRSPNRTTSASRRAGATPGRPMGTCRMVMRLPVPP
jgi:hypothetical protein